MARTDRYGQVVNRLDWLKFVALIIMTIDHVGMYVMVHDPLWWKAIGRITFPVWFFLAGYSQSRTLGGEIVWLGVVLAIVNYLGGWGVFPLNALFSIVICRYIVQKCRDRGWTEKRPYELFFACFFLAPFTIPFFEYGALGVLFALMGDMIRRGIKGEQCIVFATLSTGFFIAYQFLWYDFDIWQGLYVTIGTSYTVWVLYHLQPGPSQWVKDTGWFNWLVRFIGRNTMHYYFAHRVVLQLIALLMGIRAFNPSGIFG